MKTLDQASHLSAHDTAILEAVKEVVSGRHPSAEVLLFGSVARGTSTADSDYDILVLTDSPLPRAGEVALDDALYDVQLEHGAIISCLYFTKEEWKQPVASALPVYRAVQEEAVRL